jgi:hypothetical protein
MNHHSFFDDSSSNMIIFSSKAFLLLIYHSIVLPALCVSGDVLMNELFDHKIDLTSI